MDAIDRYVAELRACLRIRGGARRRFLREARDHLRDAAAERGPGAAVRDFGPAAEIAAAVDAEVAARRALRATWLTVTAVVAVAGSTLAVVHGARPGVDAPAGWAIAFFVAAQVSGAAAALALLQAVALRRVPMTGGDVLLAARRSACALLAAGATLFAAGAALPGRGSALLVLGGPALAACAAIAVLRARSLGRRLPGARRAVVRAPLRDLQAVLGVSLPQPGPARLLALITAAATAAAFVRDRAESASFGQALLTAGVEALAVVASFALLGGTLGLRPARGKR